MNNKKTKLSGQRRAWGKRWLLAPAAVLLVLCGPLAQACTQVVAFDIPAQPLDVALLTYARQADVAVLFPSNTLTRRESNAVSGRFCREDALILLLKGTGVEGRITESGQLVLSQRTRKPVETAPTSADPEAADEAGRNEGWVGKLLTTLFGEAGGDTGQGGRPARRQRLEEIMVTGSRIQRSGMETPTPATTVGAVEMHLLAPGLMIEALNQLPQFLGNSSPRTVGSVTGPLGASFLNLRGMGANRTLVLLDGRRVVSSNRLGVPDIALLPESMMEGMEVVTGGASAAYGSDAVSGVVNFRLDTDFTGFKGHAQSGVTSRGDNRRQEGSLALGLDLGDDMHFIAALDGFRADKLETYEDRDWFRNWGTVDVGGPGQALVVAPDVRSRQYTAGGLIRLPGSALDMTHFTHGGEPAPFEDGSLVGATRQVGGTGFYGDIASKEEDQTGHGSLYPETSRNSLFLYLDKDFSSGWTGYAQYLHGRSDIDYVATGAHQENEAWRATIYRENPYVPASIRDIMEDEGLASFPLYRYASRQDLARARGRQENDSRSLTLGLRGDIGGWHHSAFYQFSRSKSRYSAIDFPRLDRLYKAMDVVSDPATGQPICRSTLSFPDDGCVPANPFGPGTMSDQAVDYILEGDMYRLTRLRQHFAEWTMDTDILKEREPGPVSVAAGLSFRRDAFDVHSGPRHLVERSVLPAEEEGYRGLPEGFANPRILQFSGIEDEPLDGSFNVGEIFGEANIPLVRGRPFMQALDVSAAMRYADYDGSGGVLSWKAGLDWRLNNVLRLRLTRSRDTRAATLTERHDRSGGGGTAFDPQLDSSYAIRRVDGGNPQVDPELADTWTAGLVYHPNFLPELALSVDAYNTRIKDYITLPGIQPIIDGCHQGVMELCDYISRNPDTGEIQQVDNVYMNVARAQVRGVDLELSWQRPLDLFTDDGENLSLRLFASYLGQSTFSSPGIPTRDNAGTTELPEWSATGVLGYQAGPLRAALTGRYVGDRVQFSEPVAPGNRLDDNSVDSVWYFNLRLDYALGGPERSLYFAVDNLFDRDPPVVANWNDYFGASSFMPSLHDPLGRRYTLGIRFGF